MENTFIGIDLSLNSTGICIRTNNNFRWISFYRTEDGRDKLIRRKNSVFSSLEEIKGVSIEYLDKPTFEGEYHIREYLKMNAFSDASNRIIEILNPYLKEGCIVGIEGLSYGSPGNSLIDISMLTALVRKRIMDKIGYSNFFVFSPSTIKKWAIKGNAKKGEIMRALIQRESEFPIIKHFTDVLENNLDTWVKKGDKVISPVSDLIDATWICLFTENFLRNIQINNSCNL